MTRPTLLVIDRSLLAGAAAFGVAHGVPHDTRLMALVALAAGFVTFVAALFLTRELRGEDLRTAKAVLSRR